MRVTPVFFTNIFLLATTSVVCGQCPVSPVVTLSGNTCLGSALSVYSSMPPSSIIWTLNNSTTVFTQIVTLQSDGTTIAGGNGGGSNANQLQNPDRIYVDADGTIYIPDLNNNRIQKWAPGAVAGITVAGRKWCRRGC